MVYLPMISEHEDNICGPHHNSCIIVVLPSVSNNHNTTLAFEAV